MSPKQHGRWKGPDRQAPASSPLPSQPDADASEPAGSGYSTLDHAAPPQSADGSPSVRAGRELTVPSRQGNDRGAAREHHGTAYRDHREPNRDPDRGPSRAESEGLQPIIQRFARDWRRGREPRIEDYLADAGVHRAALLIELIQKDLEYRHKAGRAPEVGLYLERYPELDDEQAARVIVCDYELRRGRGIPVTVRDYLDRFPRLEPQLTRRFASIQSPSATKVRMPEVTPAQSPIASSLPSTSTRSNSAAKFEAKFEMIEKLGEGGMGEVWRVRHRDLGEDRAIKFILPHYAHNDESRERLRREAQAMARIDHPHAVTVHDVCMDDIPYIEMEYIRGRPLKQVIDERKAPLPREQTVPIVKQLCDVLQSAHDRRIIHRDLKPSNLMLVDGGPAGEVNLKVLDFGLAKFLDPTGELTAPGCAMGTPVYMSPEQLEESSKVDARADIYSVGVILYELLTGCRPFTSSHIALLFEIANTPAPPFKTRNSAADVEPALEKLVLRCLEKDPKRRPGSARELADEFLRLTQPPKPRDDHHIDRRLILAGMVGTGLGGLGLIWHLLPRPFPLPPHWVRAKDSVLEMIQGRSYHKVIERQVPGVEDPVVALLIAKRNDPFYIMKDKVWVGLFQAFAGENPEKVQSEWNKDAPDPRWPVLGVTAIEAQAFAEWLGGQGRGFLPTPEQWDQAAGRNRKDRREGPYQGEFDPKDKMGFAIALDQLKEPKEPKPVGWARQDISEYGCRDMSGNGWEWTRPRDTSPATEAELRAESYRASKPLRFEYIVKDYMGRKEAGTSDLETGFRVVIELEPMP